MAAVYVNYICGTTAVVAGPIGSSTSSSPGPGSKARSPPDRAVPGPGASSSVRSSGRARRSRIQAGSTPLSDVAASVPRPDDDEQPPPRPPGSEDALGHVLLTCLQRLGLEPVDTHHLLETAGELFEQPDMAGREAAVPGERLRVPRQRPESVPVDPSRLEHRQHHRVGRRDSANTARGVARRRARPRTRPVAEDASATAATASGTSMPSRRWARQPSPGCRRRPRRCGRDRIVELLREQVAGRRRRAGGRLDAACRRPRRGVSSSPPAHELDVLAEARAQPPREEQRVRLRPRDLEPAREPTSGQSSASSRSPASRPRPGDVRDGDPVEQVGSSRG